MIDLATSSLLDILPDSLASDETIVAMSQAIDDELKELVPLCYTPLIYSRIDELNSRVLDHLAWQYNADTWRDSWPETIKRAVIKSVIRNKRLKGTRGAVEEAVSSLGSAVKITEWWETEPKGEPHTFSIISTVNDFNGSVPAAEMIDDIIQRIDSVKPTRSHYTFSQALTANAGLGLAGGMRSITYKRLTCSEQDLVLTTSTGFVGTTRQILQIRITAEE